MEGAEGVFGHAGAAVERDDVAEEDFFGGETGVVVVELEEDLLHFVEHLGSAKLADDEIETSGAVAERFRGGVGVGV